MRYINRFIFLINSEKGKLLPSGRHLRPTVYHILTVSTRLKNRFRFTFVLLLEFLL